MQSRNALIFNDDLNNLQVYLNNLRVVRLIAAKKSINEYVKDINSKEKLCQLIKLTHDVSWKFHKILINYRFFRI